MLAITCWTDERGTVPPDPTYITVGSKVSARWRLVIPQGENYSIISLTPSVGPDRFDIGLQLRYQDRQLPLECFRYRFFNQRLHGVFLVLF